jgi:hypothetical protein
MLSLGFRLAYLKAPCGAVEYARMVLIRPRQTITAPALRHAVGASALHLAVVFMAFSFRVQAAVGAIRTRNYGFTRRSTVEIPPPIIQSDRVCVSIRIQAKLVADYFAFFRDLPQAKSNTNTDRHVTI